MRRALFANNGLSFITSLYGEETEYLRVFINQLRKKIEPDPAKPQYVLTEPWVGYGFVIVGL